MIFRRAGQFLALSLLLVFGAQRLSAAVADSVLTILYVGEPAPPGAVKLSRQDFTGTTATEDCSYYELMQKAKAVAQRLGANVLKIDNRRERSREQFCEALQISFYKSGDIHRWEKRFSWTRERKLVWDDFKGPVPGNAPANNAAVTSYSFGIETSAITPDDVPKIYVTNQFETGTSWVRPGHGTAAVLKHEQTHFDICELYTRILRERISKANITYKNLQQLVGDLYRKAAQEQSDRQQRYEAETQHGIIEEAQARWTTMINEELGKTEAWSSR